VEEEDDDDEQEEEEDDDDDDEEEEEEEEEEEQALAAIPEEIQEPNQRMRPETGARRPEHNRNMTTGTTGVR
jgi:hypothetical protein